MENVTGYEPLFPNVVAAPNEYKITLKCSEDANDNVNVMEPVIIVSPELLIVL